MSLEDADRPHPAWERIVQHSTELKAMIDLMVRDAHLADDTLSEVRLTIFKTWDRYDTTRPFWPWAKEIARRVSLAKLRERKRYGKLLHAEVIDDVALQAGAGGDGVAEEWREALTNCVDRLKTPHRQLIEFRWFEERGYSEIAGLVGRSVATLHVALHRIHVILRDCVLNKLKKL